MDLPQYPKATHGITQQVANARKRHEDTAASLSATVRAAEELASRVFAAQDERVDVRDRLTQLATTHRRKP